MDTYDGGPAFPLDVRGEQTPHGYAAGRYSEGMTLLDYFAGQALIGILGARNGFLVDCGTDNAPGYAYDTAEKMIEERRKRMNTNHTITPGGGGEESDA